MKNEHLSEEEIQALALGTEKQSKFYDHLQHCSKCKKSIDTYKTIFTALAEQPALTFDFTVTPPPEMSMQKIKPRPTSFSILALGILSFLTLSLGIIGCLASRITSKGFLLSNGIIIGIATLILYGLLAEMVIKYRRKMSTIRQSNLQHLTSSTF